MTKYYIKTKVLFYRAFVIPIVIEDSTHKLKVRVELELVKFLRKHKAYGLFQYEVKRNIKDRGLYKSSLFVAKLPRDRQYIMTFERMEQAFNWESTTKGWRYWHGLADEYYQYQKRLENANIT